MRVVITGLGVVCPGGIGVAALRTTLADGKISPTEPPANEAPALEKPLIYAVPSTFNPKDYIQRRKDLKLMARANRLAVAAGVLAVEDADLTTVPLKDAGIFLGVGREPGNINDILPALNHARGTQSQIDLRRLGTEGISWMNPLSSLKTLPNMSLAHLAIRLGAMGPSATFCDGHDAGTQALREGLEAIRSGRASIVLAGASDSRTSYADRLTADRQGRTEPVGEAGVVFVLESETSAVARGAHIRSYIDSHRGSSDLKPGPFGDLGAAHDAFGVALAVMESKTLLAGDVMVTPTAQESITQSTQSYVSDVGTPIAITALGLRTPLGHTLETFAEGLLSGQSACAPIGAFDATSFPVRNACEVTPRNAAFTQTLPQPYRDAMAGLDDRKGELAIAAILDAISSHGSIPEDTAITYGTGLSSISVQELEEDCLPFVSTDGSYDYAAFGAAESAPNPQAPRRHLVSRPIELIMQHQGFKGGFWTHFSACAAAAGAIGQGMDLLRRGDVSCVIAGGADSMVHPFGMLPFILLGATSEEADAQSAGRPFDRSRDGFVMGEGGAFFVLERLETARAAGREVLAILHGWGSSCDAYNVTAPHPEGHGAVRAMQAALTDAGLEPKDIDYINAHGTGTPLNDVIEATAINQLFTENAPAVSSSKGQIGHTIAAAGALELAACVAALRWGQLPPNPRLEDQDPLIELNLVPRNGLAQPPRVILSNSFGFGGQNASLVVGRGDETP